MSTTRALAAALAIAALAVPAAQAQPAENAPLVRASANAQHKQDPIADIHAPLARAAAANANARAQDLRHLRVANANVGAYTPGATPGAYQPRSPADLGEPGRSRRGEPRRAGRRAR
jgi:hypothetical protein